MDYAIEQFCVKYTLPLCDIFIKPTTEGVGVSCGSVQWELIEPFEILTSLEKTFPKSSMGSVLNLNGNVHNLSFPVLVLALLI